MCEENSKTEKNEILMLFLFRGGYLTESNKLGHEIINLFKADNGNHYIYVVPWGHVSKEHVNKIGTIILARHVGNNQVEIIAKANVKGNAFPGVEDSHSKKTSPEDRNKRKENQRDLCKNIFYGGECITDIYRFDEKDDEQGILVSYEVEEFRFSKADTKTNQFPRLTYKETEETEFLIPLTGNMAKTTLREFFFKEKNEHNYTKLTNIIGNTQYWKDVDDSQAIEGNVSKSIEDYSNILKVIGKEDSEIVFSNWLFFYFSNGEMLNNFILNVLKKVIVEISDMDESFTITREKDHIDIRIEDKNQIIIIENKIKSGINGIKDTKDNTPYTKESQLSEYYNKVMEGERDKAPQRSIHCFIFVPKYNYKLIETEKDTLKDGDKYHLISYEAIYEFFSDKQWNKYKYIDDFRRALHRHTSEYPDSLREDTYHKFLERINELRIKKNIPWIGGEKREKHFQQSK